MLHNNLKKACHIGTDLEKNYDKLWKRTEEIFYFSSLLHFKKGNEKMDVEILWKYYKFPSCDNCKKSCGKYQYDNLCSNLNYLKNYGQEYFDRMKESFEELNTLLLGVVVILTILQVWKFLKTYHI